MRTILSLLPILLVALFPITTQAQEQQQTCSANFEEQDPALKEMTYDVGDGPQTFLAYVEPDVTSFYQGEPPATTKVVPQFGGFAGKFVNNSNKRVSLYWQANKHSEPILQRHYEPFAAGGTATFEKHLFFMAEDNQPDKKLIEFVIGTYPDSYYVYDPYTVEGDEKATKKNLKALTKAERKQYDQWRKTLSFSEQYRNFTGRTYLANYLRERPTHPMWRADYFGQEHWVTTKETHFESVPPNDLLGPVKERGTSRVLKEDDPRILSEYRVKDQPYLNMTLKVISCAPRAFEIKNFLSKAEVDHILNIAGGIELHDSTTGDVGEKGRRASPEKKTKTRTSKNSWVAREESPIIDAIYRRSADLLRIDEAKFRFRSPNEFPEMLSPKTIAESLQLVHYDKTQEVCAILRLALW